MRPSEPAKGHPIIGFDLDDVLLEFFPLFAEVLKREHGVDVAHVERTDWAYVEIPEITDAGLDISDVRRLVHQACHDRLAHAEAPLLCPATAECVRRLRRDGHRVVLATARPPTSAAVVAAWLDARGIVFDELRFGIESKLSVDVLVEDSVHGARGAAATGTQVFVPDRPWNRLPGLDEEPLIERIEDPEELYVRMRTRLDGVDDPYGFTTAATVRDPAAA